MKKPVIASILAVITGCWFFLSSFLLIFWTKFIKNFVEEMPMHNETMPIEKFVLLFEKWSVFFMINLFICGIILIVAGIMLYKQGEKHKIWGIVILLFSIIGMIGGGGIIGIMGVIAGVLAIMGFGMFEEEEEKRTCLNCGRLFPVKYKVCPYCGNKFE